MTWRINNQLLVKCVGLHERPHSCLFLELRPERAYSFAPSEYLDKFRDTAGFSLICDPNILTKSSHCPGLVGTSVLLKLSVIRGQLIEWYCPWGNAIMWAISWHSRMLRPGLKLCTILAPSSAQGLVIRQGGCQDSMRAERIWTAVINKRLGASLEIYSVVSLELPSWELCESAPFSRRVIHWAAIHEKLKYEASLKYVTRTYNGKTERAQLLCD